MPPTKEPTITLEQFQSSLKDLVVVCEKLSTHVFSVEDLVGMVNLSLENEGQLKMLYFTVLGINPNKGK